MSDTDAPITTVFVPPTQPDPTSTKQVDASQPIYIDNAANEEKQVP